MEHLNENNPCGRTPDPMECACGCTGHDERCAYYLAVYSFTEDQVRPEHTCCKIPGREDMAKAMNPMVSMIAEEAEDHEPRMIDTAVLRLMAEEVKDCNIAKGWYDVHPGVLEFEKLLTESGVQDDLHALLCGMVEKIFGSRTFGDDIALLHSEASEMLEAYRDHGLEDATSVEHAGNEYNPKPEGVGSEAADVLVRLLDTCHRYKIDLFFEWRRKMDYNWTRPHRHGGKAL